MTSSTRAAFLITALLAAAAARGSAAAPAPEPLTLEAAHAIALRNHPQVRIAGLQELLAAEEVKESKSAYFPTADAFGDAVDAGNRNTRILAGGVSNPAIYDRVADGVSVNELITDFGRTRNLVAGARLSARAAGQGAAATDQQILLNVNANYFNVLQTMAVLGVARETVEARRTLVEQVTVLARNQLKSELDVSFAEVAFEQAVLLQQRADGDLEGAQAGLANALGYPGFRRFQPADVPPPAAIPADVGPLVEAAIGNRPDLLRLADERDAALRFARAEKDRNYPTLNAVGEVGNAASHDYRLPNRYAVGAITLDIPLFAGGSYEARQREAEIRADIADQALRDARDNATRDVRLAWVNLGTAAQRVRTTEELLKHSNEAYRLARARYKAGSSSIVELTDAQVNATAAQIAEANARYDELIQQSVLAYQTGSLR